jgi:hypothetical protein
MKNITQKVLTREHTYKVWCREPDSNRHECLTRGILSPLRLPIPPSRHTNFLEAAPGFEPGIGVLQTPALPLGYAAIQIFQFI